MYFLSSGYGNHALPEVSVSHTTYCCKLVSPHKLNMISLLKYVTRKPKGFLKCQKKQKFVILQTNSLPSKKKVLKDLG